MKKFAQLLINLELSNSPEQKTTLLISYFRQASSLDKVWAIALLSGKRPKRLVSTASLRDWIIENRDIASWLFDYCYQTVGDMAETIALLLPHPHQPSSKSLSEWITWLPLFQGLDETTKIETVIAACGELEQAERLLFLKIVGGCFRYTESQPLLANALAEVTRLQASFIAHRLTGTWEPEKTSFEELLGAGSENTAVSRPYPFFLAYSLETAPDLLGETEHWLAEWKWEGIRVQLIKRNGDLFIWSRNEELITDKLPELYPLKDHLPDGTVLDGTLLAVSEGQIMPSSLLRARLSRKMATAKDIQETPVLLNAYDVLEWEGKDIRATPLKYRRELLEQLVSAVQLDLLTYSDRIEFTDWTKLKQYHRQSRENYAGGIVLKNLQSIYLEGRVSGHWWKWKTEPLILIGILMYAQRNPATGLFTDYTFGVWDGEVLVPVAKTNIGLDEEQKGQIDLFIKKNTQEKFGPVRTVTPSLVFEIAFESIQPSNRHKCGANLRSPKIKSWLQEKNVTEADTLQKIRTLLKGI